MSKQLLPIHLPAGEERDEVRNGLNRLAQKLNIKSQYHKSGKSGAGALLAALSKLPDAMRDDQLEVLQQMIQDSIKSPKTETVKCPQCGSSVRQDRLQKHYREGTP